MKKKLLLIAAALIVFGGVLFFTVMQIYHWDFVALAQPKTSQTVIKDPFSSVEILTETENIIFAKSEDGTCKVVFTGQRDDQYTATVEDGTLRIEKRKNRALSLFSMPEIVIFLPQAQYGALSIEEDTGDITLPPELLFDAIKITASTGDVTCNSSAVGQVSIETSTGNVNLTGVTAKDVSVFVSTGKTVLTDVSCESFSSNGSTGDVTLENTLADGMISVTRSTGDVTLNGSDADELLIETETGDVTGTLRSEKVFIVRSDTGSIDVPETVTGGKCKITTDTGDVHLKIE